MAGNSGALLSDMRILVTTLSTRERAVVHELATAQGGIILTNVTLNDPPHVIITRRAGSPKYHSVLKRHPKTPVVLPEWLSESVKAGKRLPYTDFALKACQGLTICFSGLRVDAKREFADQVVRLGGKHSASLDRMCTHLVTISTDSDKYRWAMLHNIICVTPQWLVDSITQGWCQDEKQYLVDPDNAGIPQQIPNATSKENSVLVPEATATTNQLHSAAMNGGSMGNKALVPAEDSNTEGPAVDKKALNIDVVSVDGRASQQQPAEEEFHFDDLNWDDSIPPFLDACSIWAVGCSPSELREVMQWTRQGAAKRYMEPCPGLTHIIVGSDMVSSSDAEKLSKVLSEQRAAAVVKLDWIKHSAMRKQVLPADDRFTLSQAAIAELCNRRVVKYDLPGPAPMETHNEVSNAADTDQAAGGSLFKYPSTNLASTSGCFANCYFTVAALKDSGHKAKAEKLIRSNGGKMFTSSLPVSVKNSTNARAFAICPPSLTPQQINALRSSHQDFADVDEGNRFTMYWLECCIEGNTILQHMRGSPCYKPLPYPLPIAGMENVSVAMSGYNPMVRLAIQKTVEIVGGKVTPDCMSAQNTHLIVDAARGEKYKHASRFIVVPVTADWLVDSIASGRLLPEQNYRPRTPAGQESAVLQRDNALGSGTAPSQVGGTQFGPGGGTLPAGFTSMYQAVVAGTAAGSNANAPQPNQSQAAAGNAGSLRAKIQKYTQKTSPTPSLPVQQSGKFSGVPATAAGTQNTARASTFDALFNGGGTDDGGITAAAIASIAPPPVFPPAAGASKAAAALESAPCVDEIVAVNNNDVPTSPPANKNTTTASGRKSSGRGKRNTSSTKKGLTITRSKPPETSSKPPLPPQFPPLDPLPAPPVNLQMEAQDQQKNGSVPDTSNLVNELGSFIEGMKRKVTRQIAPNSQDMAPAFGTLGSKRGASGVSNSDLDGGGRGKRMKTDGAQASGQTVRTRRSSKMQGDSSAGPRPMEMSQIVAYDTLPVEVPARSTRSGAAGNRGGDAAAKQKLRQMAKNKRTTSTSDMV